MGPAELYRQTAIGECLVEALEQMMENEKISPELAEMIINQFDDSMLEALRKHVNGKGNIKANLKTYKFFDNVWQFNLENVSFRLMGGGPMPSSEVMCEKAKVVCVDSKLLDEVVTGGGGGAGGGGAGGAGGSGGAGPSRGDGAQG